MEEPLPEHAEPARDQVERVRVGPGERAWLVLWELLALGLLLLARSKSPGGVLHSDFLAVCWLLAGIHLWRGLALFGLAKPPPPWLFPLELIALFGWSDDGPWNDPKVTGIPLHVRLFHWRGGFSVGTQPMWSLVSALVVWGVTLWRALRSERLAESRPLLLRWAPRATAGAGLVIVLAWFFGSSSLSWAKPTGAIESTRSFSWRTGASHDVRRGRHEGLWASAEGVQPAEPVLLRYRSEALLEPSARFLAVGAGEPKLLSERRLYATSPGVVRLVLQPPPALEPGQRLRLELHAKNDPRFAGTLELADLSRLRTAFAVRAEREGWLPAILSSPFAPLALLPWLLYLYARWPQVSGWQRWLGLAAAAMGCGTWLALCVPALSLLFGWLTLIPATFLMGLQSWLAILPFAEAIPPLTTFGPMVQEVMTGQLAPLFHGRPLSPGASPEYLPRLEARLAALRALPTWLVALGILGLTLGGVLSARPSEAHHQRAAGRRPSTYLFALGGLGYVLYPSWHLPIDPENQRLLALLLLAGLLVLWRGVRALEERIPPATPRSWIDPAALVLLGLYLLLRLPDLFLPPTFNSDEGGFRAAAALVFNAQRTSLGLELGVGPRLLVVGLVAGAGLVLRVLAKRFADFDRWFVGCASLGLLAWALWLPTPTWDVMSTFRYPPLAKLIPGELAWIGGESLAASRFWCLAAYAGAGYALFLGARRLGLARASAFGMLLFYLGLNMTWYWSVFAYNTAFLILFTALASVPLLGWIRNAEPEALAWTALWLAAASSSRVTGIVSFAILFLVILGTFLCSERHRTKGNAWAVAFLLVAILPGAILWHKVLVGGWYGWVGRYLEWYHFKQILENYDRWRLTGYSLVNMNGAWSCALIFLGGLSAMVARSRTAKLAAWLGTGWLVLSSMAPIILGRGQVWDGLPRFILPSLLPAALLVGLACDAAQRRFGRWAPLALVTPLLLFGRHPVADQPAALPTDLNIFVQYRGRSHGFLPEDQIVAALPAGTKNHEAVVVHEAGIVAQHLRQIDPAKIGSLESIDAEMKRLGFRVFILPYAPDPIVNDSLWRFQRSANPTADPALWQDPDSISASPLFRPVGVVTFHGVEFRLFERTGS